MTMLYSNKFIEMKIRNIQFIAIILFAFIGCTVEEKDPNLMIQKKRVASGNSSGHGSYRFN